MNLHVRRNNRMFALLLHFSGLVLTALLVGAFCFLIYQPLERKQEDYSIRSEQLDKLLMQPGTQRSEYRRLRRQLSDMKHSVAEIHRLLALEQSEVDLIEQFEQLAASVNLQVLDHQVGSLDSLATHDEKEIEFSCHGSYASICQFLEKAEQFAKTTKLAKFELDSRNNSSGYPIQMTFVLYSEGKSHDTKETRGVL